MQLRFAGGAALALVVLGIVWAAPVGAEPGPKPGSAALPRLKCKAFATDLAAETDSRDASTDLGRWVIEHEDRGWVVADIEWEVGQKPTGYPQGYTHVCLTPAL